MTMGMIVELATVVYGVASQQTEFRVAWRKLFYINKLVYKKLKTQCTNLQLISESS